MTEPTLSRETSTAAPVDEIRVAFWNLQNLFDVDVSPIATELGFTPVCGWDRHSLEIRIRLLAETIRGMFDGAGPDLLGLCEIENHRLAQLLIREIGRSDYQIIQAQHPEISGLDTALIYSDRIFDPPANPQGRSHRFNHRFPTRDVLETRLKLRSNDAELIVMVNHWPSRRPTPQSTEPFRIAAAAYCARLLEQCLKVSRREYVELRDNEVSLFRLNQAWDSNVLMMGDFNDNPWDASILNGLRAGYGIEHLDESIRFVRGTLPSWKSYSERPVWLFNPMWSLLASPDQGSTYVPDATHTMALPDQFLISRGLYFGHQGLKLKQRDGGRPDVRIHRPEMISSGRGSPREYRLDTRSGYSDHFPILSTLNVLPREG